jgi:hypothetical protein
MPQTNPLKITCGIQLFCLSTILFLPLGSIEVFSVKLNLKEAQWSH